MRELELHPLCTLFPRLTGAEFDDTRFTGVRGDRAAYAEFNPSDKYSGYWDAFIGDTATGIGMTSRRPVNVEGMLLLLDESGGRDAWSLSASHRATSESHTRGTVYFIQEMGGGAVKIGWTGSSNTTSRLKQLQCGNPSELVLRKVVDDVPIAEERRLHARFAHLHLRGEWFDGCVLGLLGGVE